MEALVKLDPNTNTHTIDLQTYWGLHDLPYWGNEPSQDMSQLGNEPLLDISWWVNDYYLAVVNGAVILDMAPPNGAKELPKRSRGTERAPTGAMGPFQKQCPPSDMRDRL